MTWSSFHRRGDVLRAVSSEADVRQDGLLPLHVAGVSETFRDDLDLVAALQLQWHTRLAGTIERHLAEQPADTEAAVVAAWCETAGRMPGVRLVLDRATHEPHDERMAETMSKATEKIRTLLAVMAGRTRSHGADAVAAGAQVEARARREYDARGRAQEPATEAPYSATSEMSPPASTFVDRLKAALDAA